jgi:hypothetical protein
MFATRNLSEAIAPVDVPAAGRPLIAHVRLIDQPAARNKLICGWRPQAAPMAHQDKGGSMAL